MYPVGYKSQTVCIWSKTGTLTTELSNLSRLIKNNYTNIALLKDLMTIPPMTAQQHAEIMRKRIAHRRMLEEAKELKTASEDRFKE